MKLICKRRQALIITFNCNVWCSRWERWEIVPLFYCLRVGTACPCFLMWHQKISLFFVNFSTEKIASMLIAESQVFLSLVPSITSIFDTTAIGRKSQQGICRNLLCLYSRNWRLQLLHESREGQADSSKTRSKFWALNYSKIHRVNPCKLIFLEMFELCWCERQTSKPG